MNVTVTKQIHPVTERCIPAMAIKFIYHKGANNKPKP